MLQETLLAPPPLTPDVEGEAYSPAQRLEPDFRHFRLLEDATYTWWHPLGKPDKKLHRLVLPAGFAHDFATIPRPLWATISPLDLGLASIFHDWLYSAGGKVVTLRWEEGAWAPQDQPWDRRHADELFARIMREQGVPRWRRRAAYLAVRAFGRKHWG
jgi:hypothetical protein